MNAAAADAEEIHRLALPQSPRLHFSHELENQTTAILFTSTAAASHGNFTTAFDVVLGRVFL